MPCFRANRASGTVRVGSLPGCDSGEAEMVHEPTPVRLPAARNQINPLAAVLPELEELGLIALTTAGREMLKIGTSGESANGCDAS